VRWQGVILRHISCKVSNLNKEVEKNKWKKIKEEKKEVKEKIFLHYLW
jgi:hypothetical protein